MTEAEKPVHRASAEHRMECAASGVRGTPPYGAECQAGSKHRALEKSQSWRQMWGSQSREKRDLPGRTTGA